MDYLVSFSGNKPRNRCYCWYLLRQTLHLQQPIFSLNLSISFFCNWATALPFLTKGATKLRARPFAPNLFPVSIFAQFLVFFSKLLLFYVQWYMSLIMWSLTKKDLNIMLHHSSAQLMGMVGKTKWFKLRKRKTLKMTIKPDWQESNDL